MQEMRNPEQQIESWPEFNLVASNPYFETASYGTEGLKKHNSPLHYVTTEIQKMQQNHVRFGSENEDFFPFRISHLDVALNPTSPPCRQNIIRQLPLLSRYSAPNAWDTAAASPLHQILLNTQIAPSEVPLHVYLRAAFPRPASPVSTVPSTTITAARLSESYHPFSGPLPRPNTEPSYVAATPPM